MQINQRSLSIAILIVCLIAIPVSFIGAGKRSSNEGSQDSSDKSESFASYIDRDHISVIRLSGIIADDEDDSSLFSKKNTAAGVLKQLRKAVKNDHVKGVLFRIDSPGGTVPTSQEIADEIKTLKEQKKPVVVSMADVAASGGYYVSCNADKIVADPGTITGSIGVIMSNVNLKGLGDKLGLQPQVIKSGLFKDIGSPYRAMTVEEKSILQGLILDAYDQFTTEISQGRKMPIETVRKIADGRIYSGRQALKLNLVDKLGGYTVAIDLLQDLCKERYGNLAKFPVKEGSPRNALTTILESVIGGENLPFAQSASYDQVGLGALIPESLKSKYSHQPLWLMP
jgi:protease IV